MHRMDRRSSHEIACKAWGRRCYCSTLHHHVNHEMCSTLSMLREGGLAMSHVDPVFVNEFGETIELLRKVQHGA